MNNQNLNESNTSGNSKIELRLLAQNNKLQNITNILEVILIDLNEKPDSQKDQEQLLLTQRALFNLSSNSKRANALNQESQANTQQSLDAIKQENQNLQAYCKQIKQQLTQQDEIIQGNSGIKLLSFQCCSALLIATFTVVGIRFFPPSIDSMLPSKNDPELQKQSSDKTLRKSK
jgi:hypothetical protein